jgi:hypothetical protein
MGAVKSVFGAVTCQFLFGAMRGRVVREELTVLFGGL